MKYGFDFGTSNSAISLNTGDSIRLLPVEPASPTPEIMPSLWYFEEIEKRWFFGNEAVLEYKENDGEGRFIQSLKKVLADPSLQGTQVGTRYYSLENLAALFFKEIKERADHIVGTDVKAITIGRPVRFSADLDDTIAENRLRTAAENAGFREIDFMFEPLAATYTLKKNITKPSIVFTLDMGGGTTDISLVRLHPEKSCRDRVLAANGISIGGTDFTGAIMENRLMKYFGLGSSYKSMFGQEMPFPRFALRHITHWYTAIKIIHDRRFNQFLKEVKRTTNAPEKIQALEALIFDQLGLDVFNAIENAKIELSISDKATIDYVRSPIRIDESLLRSEFQQYIGTCYNDISALIADTLSQTELEASQVDAILMVGGSSRIPLFKNLVQRKFPGKPVYDADFFTSVAYGLSVASFE